MRKILFVLMAAAIVAAGVAMIHQKESVLAQGTPVLLRLAPVDPRSLMQGDYMALNYEASTQAGKVPQGEGKSRAHDGNIVLLRADDGTASFVRFDDGSPLGAGEIRLRYRMRGDRIRLGAESFFFQDGTAKRYEGARYGELRVAPSGESILVGLRDEALQSLGFH